MNQKLLSNDIFLKQIFKLTISIIAQGFFTSMCNFIDVFMVGQLGDIAVAAVGIGNQVFYIFLIACVGITAGAGIFTAQFWGAKDFHSLRLFQGIAVQLNLFIGLIFVVISIAFPRFVISLFTQDPVVIKTGIEYLLFITPTFLFVAITTAYSLILRTIRKVNIPLISTLIGTGLNTFLNYCLIYGNLGFPQLGVRGAAIATTISRFLEVFILISIVYKKKFPVVSKIKELFGQNKETWITYLKIVWPVFLHNFLWIIGTSIYSMIYGRISTAAYAAYNVACSFEKIALIVFNSFGHVCSILVGNSIGAGLEYEARTYAKKMLFLSFIVWIVTAASLIVFGPFLSNIYKISPASLEYLHQLIFVLAIIMIFKSLNMVFNMGIFRGGGDTKFAMTIDLFCVWFIGVPLAFVTSFIFKFPISIVIIFVSLEEVVKSICGYARFLSGKWLHNLIKK